MTAKALLAMRSQFGDTHRAKGRDYEAEHGISFTRIRRSLASTSSEFRTYPDRRTAVQTVLQLNTKEHQAKRQHMKNYAAYLQDSMVSSDLRWQQTYR